VLEPVCEPAGVVNDRIVVAEPARLDIGTVATGEDCAGLHRAGIEQPAMQACLAKGLGRLDAPGDRTGLGWCQPEVAWGSDDGPNASVVCSHRTSMQSLR
jgi:hypothetical protein